MEGCTYRININGHYEEFSSEDELNSFIRKNRATISAAMLSDKVMFSKDKSTQQNVFGQLKALSDEINFEPTDHKFTYNNEEFMSVTKLIQGQGKGSARDRLGHYLVKPFDMVDWEANVTKQMSERVDENNNPVYTPEQIKQTIADKKKSWEASSLLGTSWHNIAQAYFDGKIQSIADIISNFPDMDKVPPFVLQKYITLISRFKESLDQKYPNALYLTETNLFNTNAKIAGIADLIVVDEQGKLHIYDYKTSLKDETLWNSNKNDSNRYQLAFYRQILRSAGYDVASTYIVPVNIKDVDYTNNVIYDFDISNPASKYFKETEPLMQNVKNILPFSFGNKLNSINENTTTHQFIKEAFNFEQKKTVRGTKSVDDEYDRLISYAGSPDAKFWSYRPRNNNNQQYLIAKNLPEQTIKDRISQILQDIDEANSKLPNQINDLVKNVKTIISNGGKIDDYTWSAWSEKSTGTNIKIKNLLFKYINDPSWEIVESDALSDLNLVSFENNQTNEVDFISLSSDSLTAKPELILGKTILGNFATDRIANAAGIYREATNGDVELLKAYTFIKQNKSLFLDKKIGSIYAVNLLEGNRIPHIKTQSTTALESWYSALIERMPPQLGFKVNNWQPQQIDKTRAFITYITDLVDRKDWRDRTTGARNISTLLSRYNSINTTDNFEKTQVLGDFVVQLTNAVDNDMSSLTNADVRDTGLAIKLAVEAIYQLNDIPTMIEEDLKKWGNFLNESANLTDPNMFKNNSMKQLVTAVTTALSNTRLAYLNIVDKAGGIRDIHADLYDKTGSFVKLKALGYNLDIFKDLIERDANGKPLMRFVDPAKLGNPAQRNYVERSMKLYNDVRVEKFKDRGKDDEWIENFLKSDDARNIPLMKASALTAFKGKDLKTFANDLFRDVLNPNNIFKEDAESLEKIKLQKEMFNPFDIYDVDLDERDKRLTRIDSSVEGELETDLELVMGMYMMAHAKQQEVSKQMPVINAIKTMTMLDEVFNFHSTPNVKHLQEDYIGTTILGKTILGGESEGIAKLSKAGQEVTSWAVLGLSPFAGATEMITGFFGNVSRLISGKYNQHGFSIGDYTKAHAIVAGTIFDNTFSYDLVNFCDALNETYGISDMDVKQMVHELQTTSKGMTHFKSKYAYWFNTFPGYFNRMILFVASAIKDGTISVDSTGHITKDSAYQMIDGKLVYDEKHDKRFKLYTNNKSIPDSKQTTEWKNQKALYDVLKGNLAQEPSGLKADGTLNRPYDNFQRNSLKEFADEVHGSYDTENKNNMQKMAFGRIFMQFKGWIRAKKNRYWTDTQVNEKRGGYVLDTDENGNPVYNWKGKVTEGILQTIMATYDSIKANQGNILKTWESLDNTQKENYMFLLGDTLILGLLSFIAALFTEPNMQKNNPTGYQALSALRNSSHDFFIGYTATSVAGTKNPVALVSWGTKMAQDSWSVITGGKDPSDLLKNVAVFRTISNVTKTVTGTSSSN